MSLDDAQNIVDVIGHKGPHPEKYHQQIYDRLNDATYGRSLADARSRLNETLDAIGTELQLGGELRDMIVRPGC